MLSRRLNPCGAESPSTWHSSESRPILRVQGSSGCLSSAHPFNPSSIHAQPESLPFRPPPRAPFKHCLGLSPSPTLQVGRARFSSLRLVLGILAGPGPASPPLRDSHWSRGAAVQLLALPRRAAPLRLFPGSSCQSPGTAAPARSYRPVPGAPGQQPQPGPLLPPGPRDARGCSATALRAQRAPAPAAGAGGGEKRLLGKVAGGTKPGGGTETPEGCVARERASSAGWRT